MWQEYYEPQISARNRYAVTYGGATEARLAAAEARAARSAGAGRPVSTRRRRTLAGSAVAAIVAAAAISCVPVWSDLAPTAPSPTQIAPAGPQIAPQPPVDAPRTGHSAAQ